MSSGGVNVSPGRLHHSPSRVDKLLVDVQKEHAKVTLVQLLQNIYQHVVRYIVLLYMWCSFIVRCVRFRRKFSFFRKFLFNFAFFHLIKHFWFFYSFLKLCTMLKISEIYWLCITINISELDYHLLPRNAE